MQQIKNSAVRHAEPLVYMALTSTGKFLRPFRSSNNKIKRGTFLIQVEKMSLFLEKGFYSYVSIYGTLLLTLAATLTITPHIRKIARVIGIPTFIISGNTSGRPAVRKGG